jgi:thiol:disulfide interchange protein DsbC
MKLFAVLMLTVLGATLSHAGEKEARRAVQALAPEVKIVSITAAPVAGLYEVVIDGPRGPAVVYASTKGDHVIVGELLDVKQRRNLTDERMEKLTAVKFDSLPLNQAIKVVKGNGKRKLVVFSDPDCPFCKKLEPELAKLNDVTIYTFPYPLPMHPDAARKSKLVWCAKDRVQAWDDLMLRGRLPANGRTDCGDPVEANLALGQKLRIEGTPALIFADGRRVPGYVEAANIEQLLNRVEGGKQR